MRQSLKRYKALPLLAVMLVPAVAKADLLIHSINSESLARAGAGTAIVGGVAAVAENPSGLSSRVEGLFELNFEVSIGGTQAPEYGNEDQGLFTPANTFLLGGGVAVATEGWGLGVTAGQFGGTPRAGIDDIDEDFSAISTFYVGAGLGVSLLPSSWSQRVDVGGSYLHLFDAGYALVGGVQVRLFDTLNHRLELGASQRNFLHGDRDELVSLYADPMEGGAIDLPDQMAVGASWTIKGVNNSFVLSADYKESDYSEVLYLNDYGDVKSWSPAFAGLGMMESTHFSIRWSRVAFMEEVDREARMGGRTSAWRDHTRLFSDASSWTFGYSKGTSESGHLKSQVFGLGYNLGILGVGYQLQNFETQNDDVLRHSLMVSLLWGDTEFY